MIDSNRFDSGAGGYRCRATRISSVAWRRARATARWPPRTWTPRRAARTLSSPSRSTRCTARPEVRVRLSFRCKSLFLLHFTSVLGKNIGSIGFEMKLPQMMSKWVGKHIFYFYFTQKFPILERKIYVRVILERNFLGWYNILRSHFSANYVTLKATDRLWVKKIFRKSIENFTWFELLPVRAAITARKTPSWAQLGRT